MEQRFNSEMMVARARGLAKEIRQSEAYPAVLGAVAGGIAGALMAALIASQFAPRAEPSPQPSPVDDRRERARAGFAVRDAVQLLAVVAGLIKQAREWYARERERD